MKQGRTLSEVLGELSVQKNAKRDFISPARAASISPDARQFILKGSETHEFGMTDLFHRQVGTALGIPAKYYEAMRTQKPDLLAENVNAWLGDLEQSYMVRALEYDGVSTARAFLSDRYHRIDNLEVATAILPMFAGREGMEVTSCEVTESRLYLKIVNHRLEQEVVPGDIVQSGVVISNSEVGLGAVAVQPLLYRLVCSNGMIINEMSERRTHIGRANKGSDASFIFYTDETVEAEDRAFMLKLRDTAKAALDSARFAQSVDRLRASTEAPITGRVQEVVELTGKNYDLSIGEQDSILNYLIRGGDLSLYGLSNAITRTSQDVESYDRATALEGIGWQVATMPEKQWKEINA